MADQDEVVGQLLAGIVACGVLAGESDGEVKPEEVDTLVAIVTSFLEGVGGPVSPDAVRVATAEIAQQVSDQGAESFLVHLGQLLTDADQRRMGCMIAAAVIAADGEVARGEATMFDRICAALGFSEDEAQEIWDEVIDAEGDADEE